MRIRNIIICAVIGIIAYIIIVDDDKQRAIVNSNAVKESEESTIDNEILNAVIKLCPDLDEQTISVVVNSFQRNAEAFAIRWGSQGIMLLNHLGAAGLEVGHEHAEAFSRCIPYMNPSTAGNFILAYAKIGKDLIKSGDLEFLLRRVNQLSERQRNLALKYPQAWPFLLCAPDDVERALNVRPETCTKTFFFHDLTEKPDGLVKTCEMIIESKDDGQMCAGVAGLDGLLIQNEFPCVFRGLSANGKNDLAIVIEILKNNIEGARKIVARHGHDRLVDAVNSVVEADLQCRDPLAGFNQKRSYGHVYNAALYSPNALELIADHGKPGTNVLINFGSIGCDIFYRYYANDQRLVKPLLESLTQDFDYQANLSCSIILEFAESVPYHNDFCSALNKAYSKRHEKGLYWLNIFPAISKEINNPSEFFALFKKQPRNALKDINGSYWTESAIEAIPGRETFVVLDVLFHGEIPTIGQLMWAGQDVAFIVWDVVTAIPSAGTGPLLAESVRAALKGVTKTTLKKSVKSFKNISKYTDDTINKSIDFVQLGGKARVIDEISTVLRPTSGKGQGMIEILLKKGWRPEMSFARLASRSHKLSVIKLTNPQKDFLTRLTENWILDWTVGFTLIEVLKSDATHSIIRKAVVLKEEAARISQIHLGQVADWLKIAELKN